jgi:hypothetical protein
MGAAKERADLKAAASLDAAVLQSSEGSTLRANAGDGERFGSSQSPDFPWG